MDNVALRETARATLYVDKELGCGNFLFKARRLGPTPDTPFLFLEGPFTTPFGETFTKFSFDTLHEAVKSLAQWYVSYGIKRGRNRLHVPCQWNITLHALPRTEQHRRGTSNHK